VPLEGVERVRRRAALVVAAGLLVLGACAGGDDREEDGARPADEAADVEARTLTLAIGGEPDDGFDPTLGWGRYGSPLFQSTLLARDADLNVVPDLATDHAVSDDGLTWTVTIRDDATFSDGEPVTARDVAYTFETAARSGGLTDVTVLDRAVAVDEHTVELHLRAPQSTFVNRLVSLGIVPEHAHDERYARNPIGSGPYVLVQWDQGQQLVVERNETYYGPRPAFDRLVFLFTDEDAGLAAARAGEVDLVAVPAVLATGAPAGMHLVDVPAVDNRGIMLPTVPDAGEVTAHGAPIGNDVTADPAVRRALNVAVDRAALVDGLLEGFGSPAYGPVDGLPWFEPRSAVADGDVEAAGELLATAGWLADDDGVRTKGGRQAAFRLLYPAGDSIRQGLALAVADMVRPAGIEIEAVGASWQEIERRMHADAVLFGWGSHDPTEMYNLYHSSRAGVEYWNPGFYRNERVDEYLDLALGAPDQEEANVFWRAAQLDDDGVGFGAPGDAAWAWLVNLDHTYYVDDCLDVGTPQVEPHGHGWPITAGIAGWRWTC
jgi:peptide/nickel transport system substrate-binding protein